MIRMIRMPRALTLRCRSVRCSCGMCCWCCWAVLGGRAGEYSGLQLGRSKEQVSAMESERGGDVRYQLFLCPAGPDMGSVHAASPCLRAPCTPAPSPSLRLCPLWCHERGRNCCDLSDEATLLLLCLRLLSQPCACVRASGAQAHTMRVRRLTLAQGVCESCCSARRAWPCG